MSRTLLALAVLFLLAVPAAAVEPDEVLDDPALEARARTLSQEIRCLVCQNESIDSSNADLAKDLRIIVRERLVAGDSDQEVLDYLVARYGDYVLLRPPVKPGTYLLWFGPALLLALGVLSVAIYFRRRRPPQAAGLSAEEEARVATLMDQGDDTDTGPRS
ncbi:MAG: cytochrome c-type biogenesis protein [Pseudomonadota bacterium]